jgi:membrane protease YdiL (CAAX protease family)
MFASLPWPFIVANVLFALGCVALVGVLTRNDPSRLRRLGLSTPQPNWSAVLWLCVMCVGLVALSVALTMGLAASGSLGGIAAPAITPYWPVQTSMGIAFAISMAPLAALGEELLYRGYVQRGLLERWSPAPGILLTALCSALGRGWPDLVYALPSTVFLGWAAYRTDSTRASFIIHVAGNAALYCLVQTNHGWWRWMASMTNGSGVLLVVPGALALAIGLRGFRRSVRARPSTT